MGKAATLFIFTLVTPMLLCITVTSLLWYSHKNGPNALSGLISMKKPSYAALPAFPAMTAMEVTGQDARVEMVKQFFGRYSSPLEPFAQDVIDAADRYGLDFRLIPAIAMQESTLCKKMPKNSYNCWGFGIYGKKVTRFSDYKEAIYTVTKTLATNYKKDGLHSPEQIMSRYTPSSNGSWATGVTTVINWLQ